MWIPSTACETAIGMAGVIAAGLLLFFFGYGIGRYRDPK